jgi:hypothetical protein
MRPAPESRGQNSMSLQGTGVIAIWHDISPEGLEAFYEWHNREHIPERVGIEGFLRGRRYIATFGAPAFFTLYNTRDVGVLSGPAYHARLNDPTPWTLRTVGYFSNESRSLCEVRASRGVGAGGSLGTIRFDCDPDQDETLMRELAGLIPEISGQPAIAGIHICRADLDSSRRRSAEQKDRADNKVPRWIILVEGSAEAVGKAMAGELGTQALAARGVPEHERSIYQLQHVVVKVFG